MQEIGQTIMNEEDQKKVNEVCKKLERKTKPNTSFGWDAEFYAFGKLSGLISNYFLSLNEQLTVEQANAIHSYAETMARDLTSGQYEFVERRQKK